MLKLFALFFSTAALHSQLYYAVWNASNELSSSMQYPEIASDLNMIRPNSQTNYFSILKKTEIYILMHVNNRCIGYKPSGASLENEYFNLYVK
jgi:hypothetical protein